MEQPSRTNNQERIPGSEIERKYLLASEDDANRLEEKIKQLFPDSHLVGDYSETSYYYPKITKEKAKYLLSLVVGHGKENLDWQDKLDHIPETTPIIFRLRTRKSDNDEVTSLTFKAGQNPLHDVERIEIESNDLSQVNEIAGKLGIQPLNQGVLDAMYRQYGKNWQKYYTSKGYYPNEGDDGYFNEEDWKEIESESTEKVIKKSDKLKSYE